MVKRVEWKTSEIVNISIQNPGAVLKIQPDYDALRKIYPNKSEAAINEIAYKMMEDLEQAIDKEDINDCN